MTAAEFRHVLAGDLQVALDRVDDRSHAFWRRAIVIPFKRTFDGATRDNHLSEKLRAEGSGILNWIIEGAVAWAGLQRHPPMEASSVGLARLLRPSWQ